MTEQRRGSPVFAARLEDLQYFLWETPEYSV
jgi:hypothetical protein